MKQAFIIMQIGNAALERVYHECFLPVLRKNGFEPKRVDKHNQGRLLKSEIVDFIQSSDLILADLTNERPNCYLEIGYAMGLDKFNQLILTAREDHNHQSPNYNAKGPRIHFDLSGYDILFWHPDELEKLRTDLEKKIQRRVLIVSDNDSSKKPGLSDRWFTQHREAAYTDLEKNGFTGYMELQFSLDHESIDVPQTDLLKASQSAQIHTFGWPIGASDTSGSAEFRPKSKADGIFIKIISKDSFDYWSLRKNGDFYLLQDLFEDHVGRRNSLFFNTRVVRITESILYAAKLYHNLGLEGDSVITMKIRHGGLIGREVAASTNRYVRPNQKSSENEIETINTFRLAEVESDLTGIVEKFTSPLFVVFDYFSLDKNILKQIVDDFVAGRVT